MGAMGSAMRPHDCVVASPPSKRTGPLLPHTLRWEPGHVPVLNTQTPAEQRCSTIVHVDLAMQFMHATLTEHRSCLRLCLPDKVHDDPAAGLFADTCIAPDTKQLAKRHSCLCKT